MAIKTMQKKRKAPATESSAASRKSKITRIKPTKPSEAATAAATIPAADEIPFDPSSDSEPDDDQTAALLKGFESDSDDEAHAQKKDPSQAALDLSTLPDPSSAVAKSSKKKGDDTADGPTTLYISRIPHGFYEAEMQAYFSQFGDIKRLRMARNRRTGASKHYAFLEFESAEVARIVQQTMDNYLMFRHILKVRLVPRERVHEELWKGAGKRFRKVPWNRIEMSRVASTDREGWGKRLRNEENRRLEKMEKMKALGYEFEAPALRTVESVPRREVKGVAEKVEQEQLKLEQTPAEIVEAATEEPKKKVKKTKQTAGDEVVEKLEKEESTARVDKAEMKVKGARKAKGSSKAVAA